MRWSDIPWKPTNRTLREFAAVWTVFFAGLAAWQGFVSDRPALAVVLAVLAVTVGPLGLVWPQAIRPLFVAATVVTFPIGWVISRVVLACLFYGLFTPIALFFRLTGRDALCRRYQPNRATYWAEKPMTSDPRSYINQF